MIEIYNWIKGYENLYKVSNYGNVKTYNWRNSKREAILKPAKTKDGYLQVALQKDGKLKSFKVHRLVALTFLDNPENKPQVNHIDCDKTNNKITNLEWVTAKENTAHSIKMGTFSFQSSAKSINRFIKRGELNGGALLTDLKVKEIRSKFVPRKYTRKMLALEYNVKESTIKDVLSKKSWKHIN
jgi:hypothetical protein